MSVSELAPNLPPEGALPAHDRAFLGHPKALGYLGFAEGCERFSYYSMQTLLVLYMTRYLLLPAHMPGVTGLVWMQNHVFGGLKGEAIPLAARIVAVADTYDALISDRPYRAAVSQAEAVAEIRALSGRRFDPAVVEAFLKTVAGANRP